MRLLIRTRIEHHKSMEKPPRGEKQLRAEENLLRKAKERTIVVDDVQRRIMVMG